MCWEKKSPSIVSIRVGSPRWGTGKRTAKWTGGPDRAASLTLLPGLRSHIRGSQTYCCHGYLLLQQSVCPFSLRCHHHGSHEILCDSCMIQMATPRKAREEECAGDILLCPCDFASAHCLGTTDLLPRSKTPGCAAGCSSQSHFPLVNSSVPSWAGSPSHRWEKLVNFCVNSL